MHVVDHAYWRTYSMARMFISCCLLLTGYLVSASAPDDLHSISDLHAIRGGEDIYCAMPYPIPTGGCIGQCAPWGNYNMAPPGMPPMLVPVWRRCLTAQGDDKCWQSPSITTTRCIKTQTPCPPVNRGLFTDAQCVNQVTTIFNQCALQYVKATSGIQPGVSCVGMPTGMK